MTQPIRFSAAARFAAALVILAASIPGVPAAVESEEPQKVVIGLRLAGTNREGLSGGFALDDKPLAAGESARLAVHSAPFPDVDPCTYGAGNFPRTWSHRWVAHVKVLEIAIDRIVFDVDWKHYHADQPGADRIVQGDRRVVTLSEEQSHPLDFLHVQSDKCRFANQLVQLEARRIEPNELQGRTIAYDLWLTHEGGPAGTHTERIHIVGEHAEQVKFRFQPLECPIAGTNCGFATQVSGGLRGRLRADGSIDVTFDARQSLSQRSGAAGGFVSTGTGSKGFNIRPREPVKIVLPQPGRSGSVRCRTTSGTETSLDTRTFFEGHSTSLVVTATPD